MAKWVSQLAESLEVVKEITTEKWMNAVKDRFKFYD